MSYICHNYFYTSNEVTDLIANKVLSIVDTHTIFNDILIILVH